MTHETRVEYENREPRSPYGVTGQRVGELAHTLQGRLASPDKELLYAPGERPRWTDDDRLVFGYVLDLGDSLSVLDKEFPAIGRLGSRFSSADTFESCLSFGDMRWFMASREAAWGVTPEEAFELIRQGGSFPYEELIMRCWKTPEWNPSYDGANLAAQWPEWRRGLGEHSDPLLLSDAAEALGELEHEMLSGE